MRHIDLESDEFVVSRGAELETQFQTVKEVKLRRFWGTSLDKFRNYRKKSLDDNMKRLLFPLSGAD